MDGAAEAEAGRPVYLYGAKPKHPLKVIKDEVASRSARTCASSCRARPTSLVGTARPHPSRAGAGARLAEQRNAQVGLSTTRERFRHSGRSQWKAPAVPELVQRLARRVRSAPLLDRRQAVEGGVEPSELTTSAAWPPTARVNTK